ncbi:MAG: magnesium chelatase [Acidobacteriaceae bacterium]
MSIPLTLGELKSSSFSSEHLQQRSVKDELRENLIQKLKDSRGGGPIFPGIIGFDDTVVPQIVNAILSRHNFILLGLRGQAKSRILRALTTLLDPQLPYVKGCEIHDNPYLPICKRCRDLIAAEGDATPIAWLAPEQRFVEKLATPDVTVADLIGDIDPIKAARTGTELSSELTMHYGLLPRANRCIFAINELPDLAGKIQVALFNIMQEGDVQIKGYPVRLNLDVALVFSANPEDYTARGKIVTPLKDRIGSEIRTHYASSLDEAIRITAQEAWATRGPELKVPEYIREVIEHVAFVAREDKRVDKRSGVSQRLSISCMENVISSAEQRAILNSERLVVPRVSDIYAAMPSITGKIELEYEGEVKGADVVAREIIRLAIARAYDRYFYETNTQQIQQWFDLGGEIKFSDALPSSEQIKKLKEIQGLWERLSPVGLKVKTASPEEIVSAAEFLLEGLYAHRKIGRNEERGFTASVPERDRDKDKQKRTAAAEREELPQVRGGGRRGFN